MHEDHRLAFKTAQVAIGRITGCDRMPWLATMQPRRDSSPQSALDAVSRRLRTLLCLLSLSDRDGRAQGLRGKAHGSGLDYFRLILIGCHVRRLALPQDEATVPLPSSITLPLTTCLRHTRVLLCLL